MPRVPRDWRSRIEWRNEKGHHSFEFILRFQAKKVPKGFDREIGRLSVNKSSPYYVDQAFLIEEFRGKGLGLKMYIRARKSTV